MERTAPALECSALRRCRRRYSWESPQRHDLRRKGAATRVKATSDRNGVADRCIGFPAWALIYFECFNEDATAPRQFQSAAVADFFASSRANVRSIAQSPSAAEWRPGVRRAAESVLTRQSHPGRRRR